MRTARPGTPRYRVAFILCSLLAVLVLTLRLWASPLGGQVRTLSDKWRQGRDPHDYVEPAPGAHDHLKGAVVLPQIPGEYHSNLTYQSELASRPSQYARFIEADLAPWKQSGITEELLGYSEALPPLCEGPYARIQISRGSLWVKYGEVASSGSASSAQQVAAAARAQQKLDLMLLGILDALSVFGSKIPDVDAVLHAADVPCMRKKWQHGGPAQVLLGMQGSKRHFDIPLPHPAMWMDLDAPLQGPDGQPVYSWDQAAGLLQQEYANTSLLVRIPQAMWRGPPPSESHPERSVLRQVFTRCGRAMLAEERPQEAALFNVQHTPVALQDVCDFRYAVHIEALGISPDLKHKLACGSVVVAFDPEYWEFWSRALRPGRDYVALTNEEDHICNETARAAADMNAIFSVVGRSALTGPKAQTPTLAAAVEDIRRNPAMESVLAQVSEDDVPAPGQGEDLDFVCFFFVARGMKFTCCIRSREKKGPKPQRAECLMLPVCKPVTDGAYSWGSKVTPWEIAWAGYDFVHQNVRLEDAVIYIRDLFKAYAKLQDFQVVPKAGSSCLNGQRLLQRFGGPRSTLGAALLREHPWIADFEGNCRVAEKYWDDVH